MSSNFKSIIESKSDYEFFLKSNEGPAVIIIEAKWSGCCQIMEPIIEKLTNQFSNRIKIISVKSELSQLIKTDYDFDVLPKFIFFSKSKIVDQVFGTSSFSLLEDKMNTLLEFSSNKN
jgi:thioredoxin 1